MRVDTRIAHGLTLITLAIVAVQIKVLTVESIGGLVLVLMTSIANLLADPQGLKRQDSHEDRPACPHGQCPLKAPAGENSRPSNEPPRATGS